GENKDNMRGARVFELNESNPTDYTSRMVYHKDIQDNIVSPVEATNDVDGSETLELKKSIIEEQ
ncbi:MAG: hypothetical protein ACRC92_09830, partial [Peptostreptococcaceae bacterium]